MDHRVTRGSRKIIKEVIVRNDTLDPNELLPLVCEELWNRYEGEQFDYQLKRMRLETTGQVKRAIEEVLTTTRF